MGRAPCCDKANVKRGPWSPEEDSTLKNYIERYGTGGNWIALPQKVGLKRCGKSCRLRWLNYLRPNIKHGEFSHEEDRIIFNLFITIGSRWSIIAAQLPGRTDNDIKNYWNTKLKKKLMGLLPNPLRKPQPPPQPIPLPKPRTSTPTPPPPHPSLLFSPSFHIQPSQQQPAQPPAAVSPFYHSYVNNYTFPSDNSTTTTTATTTSSVATVNSVVNSCYEPFSMKNPEFVYFGSDPRNFNSHGNQQMMMGMMIKQEEEVVHHDGFEFEFDQRINHWAETMSECCFGTEFGLISGRSTNLVDHSHNHNHNHHGINKLGAEDMGLYY